MRIILKLLLFPMTLALTIIVSFRRFLCLFSGALLNVVAFVIFCIAVGTMVIVGQPIWTGLKIAMIAWFISSFGLPMLSSFFVKLVDAFNDRPKSI